jgi:hypothetical protein
LKGVELLSVKINSVKMFEKGSFSAYIKVRRKVGKSRLIAIIALVIDHSSIILRPCGWQAGGRYFFAPLGRLGLILRTGLWLAGSR